MQLAQRQQDIDPAGAGIAPKQRESAFGYQRIAKEVIASIEDRLEELMSRRPSEARPVATGRLLASRPPRRIITVLLVVGIVGVLGFEASRSETVKLMVARWAPQSVSDWLLDRQDVAAETEAPADGMQSASTYRMRSESEAQIGTAAIDQSEVVQRMARDIATLQQGIDQLKAGQDQMMRMMMRPAGLNAQARSTVPPPRPIAAQETTTGLGGLPPPVRRPVPRTVQQAGPFGQ